MENPSLGEMSDAEIAALLRNVGKALGDQHRERYWEAMLHVAADRLEGK